MVKELKLFQSQSHVLEGKTIIFVLKTYHPLIVCVRIMIILKTTMIVLLKQCHQLVS